MRRWRLIMRRWSPSGNAITRTTTEHRIWRRRCRTPVTAFMRLVEAGWDAEAAARPAWAAHHGGGASWMSRSAIAALHLGPLLSDADRRYLTCDATCEVWFERDGQVIGAGRATRLINRRLRRALEYRHPTCAVPGCGATRGLHAHHIVHWEDGGETELDNLALLAPTTIGCTIAASSPSPDPQRAHGHRQRRPSTELSIASAPTEPAPARRTALPRTHRRARRLAVVPTLPAATATNKQLGWLPGR